MMTIKRIDICTTIDAFVQRLHFLFIHCKREIFEAFSTPFTILFLQAKCINTVVRTPIEQLFHEFAAEAPPESTVKLEVVVMLSIIPTADVSHNTRHLN